MSRPVRNDYAPDEVSAPGATLQELLEERGMSQADLAERTGRPKKTINEIIQWKSAITPETAIQLERVLRVPASFWNNREANYREHLARKEEQRKLQRRVGWLKELPVSFMVKRGWIKKCSDKVDQVREVLTFFGVSTPSQWKYVFKEQRARFRQSSAFEIKPEAVASWLRRGEVEGRQIETEAFDAKVFLQVLDQARALTKAPDFEAPLRLLCAQAGVAVVFVPPPPGCRACGATQWLSPTKALIQLSLRYKTDDQLWFTFFHEAGHILKHSKKAVYLEGKKTSPGHQEEDEANRFATDVLIPPAKYRRFVERSTFTRGAIVEFANALGIGPGVVVGRLQHEGLLQWRSNCSNLKRSFRFVDE